MGMDVSDANPETQATEPAFQEKGWASTTGKLIAPNVSERAVNLNVEGRRITGPLQGFGQLWQKTYRVRLSGASVSSQELIHSWKENFSKFWPPGNNFYAPYQWIQPGEIAILNLSGPFGSALPGGRPLISTGVLVVYADENSFSFMTPEGHMFAGIITFSASEEEQVTIAQVQALIRASDPLYELTFRIGIGHHAEDQFWRKTLETLAAHHGVSRAYVQQEVTCLDRRVQWSQAKNIWKNAAILTGLYHLAAPVRWIRGMVKQ